MIKLSSRHLSQQTIFLLAIMLGKCASAIFFSTVNNYLVDFYNINASSRGFLEFFREMPGMLAILFLALLVRYKEKNIMVTASIIIASAYLAFATIPGTYTLTVFIIFIWSVGHHLNMILIQSYGVALSPKKSRGKLFGSIGSIQGIGHVIGAGSVWLIMGYLNQGYSAVFILAAIFAFLMTLSFVKLKQVNHTAQKRKRFVFRKKYSLFYTLAILFGFRKQIFLVFAPWLLIRMFNLKPEHIAILMLLAAIFGIFVRPFLGRCIDVFGEKKVLTVDAIVLLFVCAGYGFVPAYLDKTLAVPILFGLYIVDDLLFSLRSAHTTYLSKIATSHDELTTTISTSFAIEHIVSMCGPIVAGIIWITYGYGWVFAICAIVAIFMLIAALNIPDKKELMA